MKSTYKTLTTRAAVAMRARRVETQGAGIATVNHWKPIVLSFIFFFHEGIVIKTTGKQSDQTSFDKSIIHQLQKNNENFCPVCDSIVIVTYVTLKTTQQSMSSNNEKFLSRKIQRVTSLFVIWVSSFVYFSLCGKLCFSKKTSSCLLLFSFNCLIFDIWRFAR